MLTQTDIAPAATFYRRGRKEGIMAICFNNARECDGCMRCYEEGPDAEYERCIVCGNEFEADELRHGICDDCLTGDCVLVYGLDYIADTDQVFTDNIKWAILKEYIKMDIAAFAEYCRGREKNQ